MLYFVLTQLVLPTIGFIVLHIIDDPRDYTYIQKDGTRSMSIREQQKKTIRQKSKRNQI